LQTVKNMSFDQARLMVDSVFDKCYNDLEPFGRRIINENDYDRAFKDNESFDHRNLYKK
jgi:hypothetical protein